MSRKENKIKEQLAKFNEMLLLQHKLNILTCGESYLITGTTAEGRVINWNRCIRQEASEAIDSLNWKHWKDLDKPDNVDNLRIELVDIFHFILSGILEDIKSSDMYFGYLIPEYKNSSPVIETLEKFYTARELYEYCTIFGSILNSSELNFSFDDMYKLFLGKNTLNIFRQKNGYSDGTYKKQWGEVEDNEAMMSLLTDKDNFDSLYKKLSDTYQYT